MTPLAAAVAGLYKIEHICYVYLLARLHVLLLATPTISYSIFDHGLTHAHRSSAAASPRQSLRSHPPTDVTFNGLSNHT